MTLLYVASRCPWPPTSGALLRSARLIEQLGRGRAVRVAVLDRPPADSAAAPPGVEYFPVQDEVGEPVAPAGRWALRRHVLRGLVDPSPTLARSHDVPAVRRAFADIARLAAGCAASWVEWPYFAAQALRAGLPRVVADFVDVPSEIQRGCLAGKPWSVHRLDAAADVWKLERFERAVARRCAAAVVSKEEDRGRLRCPRAAVIPNGTDPRPDLSGSEAAGDRLLFVGHMGYAPNVEATTLAARLRPLVEDRLGRPVALDLVGRDPGPEVLALADPPRVAVRGFVPDVAESYAAASVVVAPIRAGGGTKLKVLEALAFGRPLVATPEAVAGHGLRAGTDYLEAATDADFAAACAQLLADPGLRRRLGRAGRERVMAVHTWDAVGAAARGLIGRVEVDGGNRGPTLEQ